MEFIDMDSKPAPIPVWRGGKQSYSALKQNNSSKASVYIQHTAITYVIETSLYSGGDISYCL